MVICEVKAHQTICSTNHNGTGLVKLGHAMGTMLNDLILMGIFKNLFAVSVSAKTLNRVGLLSK